MRLIDKEALERDFAFMVAKREAKSSGGFISDIFKMTEEFFLELLEEQPTIEVKPVVHAHWKPKSYYYICSNCGEDAFWDLDDDLSYLYCPFCGAQMDGKEDE